jgi:hypothetical protein
MPREYLRNAAPPDIFDQHPFFLVGRRAIFRVEFMYEFNGCEIIPALLFERTVAQRIVGPDAIVAGV